MDLVENDRFLSESVVFWRRRWDLNPRNAIHVLRDFESRLFDHLSTSPHIQLRRLPPSVLVSFAHLSAIIIYFRRFVKRCFKKFANEGWSAVGDCGGSWKGTEVRP